MASEENRDNVPERREKCKFLLDQYKYRGRVLKQVCKLKVEEFKQKKVNSRELICYELCGNFTIEKKITAYFPERKKDCRYFLNQYEYQGQVFKKICKERIESFKQGSITKEELICQKVCGDFEKRNK